MSISPEKIQEIVEQRSRRLLNNMSQEELYSFALQSMMQSFDQNPGVGDTDIEMLMSSIMQEEDEEVVEIIPRSLNLEDWAKVMATRFDKVAENN